jgi:CBS domain-containing protein
MKSIPQIVKMREEQVKSLLNNKDIPRLTARNAMIKPVLVYEDDEGDTILKKLKKEETNVCIVVTRDKKFVGEIADEDLIRLFLIQVEYEPITKLMENGYRREFAHRKARDLINKHKTILKPETPINKVIELIYKEGFQYIPVIDKNKRVIGVVTPSSVLDLLQYR